MEKLYTVEDVAMMTGLTGRTIRNYLADGRLKGRKIGAQWRFTDEDVAAIFSDGAQSKERAEPSAAGLSAIDPSVADYLRPQPRDCASICAVIDYPAESAETLSALEQKLNDQQALFESGRINVSLSYDEANSIGRFTIIGDLDKAAKLIKTIRKE